MSDERPRPQKWLDLEREVLDLLAPGDVLDPFPAVDMDLLLTDDTWKD